MIKDRNNPERRVWECPVCHGINAWNPEDADRAESLLRVEVATSYGSCFDNVCGHCGADLVHVDGPILAPRYTHTQELTT